LLQAKSNQKTQSGGLATDGFQSAQVHAAGLMLRSRRDVIGVWAF